MINWFAVLPLEVARRQTSWDRGQLMLRMVRLGFSYKEIAAKFNLSTSRVSQIVTEAASFRRRTPPFERWAQSKEDVLALYDKLRRNKPPRRIKVRDQAGYMLSFGG